MEKKNRIHEIEDSPKTAASKTKRIADKTRRKNKFEANVISAGIKFKLRSTSKEKLANMVEVYSAQYKVKFGEIKSIKKG